MTISTLLRCDRCGYFESDPAQIVRLKVRPSENFHLRDKEIDLCERCERILARWMRMKVEA